MTVYCQSWVSCDRLGVVAQEALFIDNSEVCVKAAQELGMSTVLFKSSKQALVDLQEALGTQ